MGSNTLTTATDGEVIPSTDHNQLVEALKENFLPRNTSTLAPTDLAGDLGSTSYRWRDTYTEELILGAIASGLNIKESSGDIIFERANVEKFRIKSDGATGLAVDSVSTDKIIDSNVTSDKIADLNVITSKIQNLGVTSDKIANSGVISSKIADLNVTTAKIENQGVTTAKIKDANVTTPKIADANVTKAKLTAVGEQISSGCGYLVESGSTIGYEDIINLSVTITTTGRPVVIAMISSGDGSTFITVDSDEFDNGSLSLKLARSGSDIITHFLDVGAHAFNMMYLDAVGAGTYTYKMQMDGNMFVISNYKLMAYEL